MIKDQKEIIALVNACLDDGMNFSLIITEVRLFSGNCSLLLGADETVWALQRSTHQKALPMLKRVKESVSRYSNMTLPTE